MSVPHSAMGWSEIVAFPGHTHFMGIFCVENCTLDYTNAYM